MNTLLAVNFGEVLLNVLAIIGIIVAGGFLIFFLGDLLISILDPENSALRKNKSKNKEIKEEDDEKEKIKQTIREYEKEKLDMTKREVLTYAPVDEKNEEYSQVDYDRALEEEKLLKGETEDIKEEPVVREPVEEEQKEQVDNEKVEEEDSFAKLREEEERFKQEKLKAATEKQNVFAEVSNKEEDEFDFDDIFFNDDFDLDDLDLDEDEVEEKSEEVVETEEEQVEETADEVVEEDAEEEEEVTETLDDVQKEIEEKTAENERLRKELEEKIAEFEKLKEESEKNREQLVVVEKQSQEEKERLEREKLELEQLLDKAREGSSIEKVKPAMSLEEYEERLETLKERLKNNEKELRGIKKEYLPLMRVRKNLESDKKKLRRREALVAKQKVLLYGVNNIVDIDEEKAHKLEEDLDLLDGLRMSVAHCEEVIKNSEERYPILETSYRILTTTVAQIKQDIEDVEASIAKLKETENNDADVNETASEEN